MQPFSSIARLRLIALAALLAATGTAAAQAHEKLRAFQHGRWVEYVVQDGRAIAEGDILLGSAADLAGLRAGPIGAKALVLDKPELLWPVGPSGTHEVPYVFEAGLRGDVDAAIGRFNAAFGGVLQWVPRTTQADYVSFNLPDPSGTCFSSIGRITGRQVIGGSANCGVGALLHEMGHAVGLWHTQADSAQGSFLDIRYGSMDPLWRAQFQPRIEARAVDGYDYGSIMHYSPFIASTTADPVTTFTMPPGIDIGLREAYSAIDIDAIRRLYGAAPAVVTVDSNPSGLQVVVDGVTRTTPATFNWRIGSLHRLDAPVDMQPGGGFLFAFGRWSHDPSTAPSAAQEWTVEPGQGFLSQPASKPRSTVLMANFARLIQVQPVVAGGQFGTLAATADTAPWPGTSDYYPQFTKFDFTATANAGYLNEWFTTSPILIGGGTGGVSTASRRLDAASPQQVGGSFSGGPAIVVVAAGAGVDGTLRANITPPGQAAPLTGVSIPSVWRSTASGSFTIAADPILPRSDSVRFALQGIDGLDNGPDGSRVAMPEAGQPSKVVTVNYQKQFRPLIQRKPFCGGTVALSNGSTWIPFGTSLQATAAPVPGVIFAGWEGSFEGVSLSSTMTVDRVPEAVANFNIFREIFAAGGVSPATYAPGPGTTTFDFTGSGFSPGMFVVLDNGTRKAAKLVDLRTFRVALTDADLPGTGVSALVLGVDIAPGCTVFSDPVAIDVLPRTAAQPVTVFEFYNAALDRYFRTASAAEAAAIRANAASGEVDTGQSFQAWTSDAHPATAAPVYRFYGSVNPGPNSHFFTANPTEARQLQRAELDTPPTQPRWNYETLAFAIRLPASGACPADAPVRIYRAYNNGFSRGRDSNHRYMTDPAILSQMIAQGWAGEGVVMCGPQ